MKKRLALFIGLGWGIAASSQINLTVFPDQPTHTVAPTMWGVFFEDINFAADGGLYAELVKNRSFEFPIAMMGWKENRSQYQKGRYVIINRSQPAANARFARITLNHAEGNYAFSNEGFRGMGFHANKQYVFSIQARTEQPGALRIRVQLLNHAGKELSTAVLEGFGKEWATFTTTLTTSDSAQRGRLNLQFEGAGVLDIDAVSLFPTATWKNRPGGLRADLVQKIADLKPGFLRFPGGCIVEGRDLANRYQWKTTVGQPADRTLIMNRWNVEFRHRAAPDYYQSFGLGFFEYFQLAEDLGAEPLPILNCGMACQFNSGEVADMTGLQPYIDDALDLIEFANGPVSSRWGKLRSEMGHPAPFNMKLLGVGNEQWEPQYIERYRVFEKAILDKYPAIQIVSGAGPYAEGEYFNYAWKELRQSKAAFVDEHYYKPPAWFLNNAARYDNYDRSGPRIFAGEYAAHIKGNPAAAEGMNCWESALAEAAFMTGLERNADLVQMCSYAPLLAHADAWQWRPDLIWFDNLRTAVTPNYYVQQLFSVNKGTQVVPITKEGKPVTGTDSLYSSAVLDQPSGELIIKLVNTAALPQNVVISLSNTKLSKRTATLHILAPRDLTVFNQLDQAEQIKPAVETLLLTGSTINRELLPHSLTVLKIPLKGK